MNIFFKTLVALCFIGNLSFAQENANEKSSDQPQFPGGHREMVKFLVDNLQYPEEAIDKGIQGQVIIKFQVDSKGKIDSVKIDKGIANCPKCNLEAIRVVESMPNWIPSKQPSKNTYLFLPIKFELSNSDVEQELDASEKTKHYDAHWAGFDIGSLMLLNQKFNTNFEDNPYWQNDIKNSVSVNLNIFEYKIPIMKQYLGLTTGFGIGISTIGFRDNYLLFHDQDTVMAVKDQNQNYRTNNLSVTYLTVPLLLEFSSKLKQKNSFYVNAGVVGGIRVGSSTNKTGKYENGDRFQTVVRSKYNLSPFSLDATVRAGYGTIGLYCSYQLTSMFKQNKTVEVYPLKVGLTLNIDYFEKKKTKE